MIPVTLLTMSTYSYRTSGEVIIGRKKCSYEFVIKSPFPPYPSLYTSMSSQNLQYIFNVQLWYIIRIIFWFGFSVTSEESLILRSIPKVDFKPTLRVTTANDYRSKPRNDTSALLSPPPEVWTSVVLLFLYFVQHIIIILHIILIVIIIVFRFRMSVSRISYENDIQYLIYSRLQYLKC